MIRFGVLGLPVALVLVLSEPALGADCIVNAHSTARLGAASKGVISEILVERGDRVSQGQVMARLESSEEESREMLARMRAESDTAIRAARTRAEAAESKAERLTTLRKRDVITKTEFEEAVLDAESARLDEEQAILDKAIAREEAKAAEAMLERKTVRAPFDGVVTDRLLSRGELYNETDPILVVARTDPLHVETFLPADELPKVSADQSVPVYLENGVTVEGRVTVIDPILDAATGTFGVRLEVANPDGTILAGQRCTLAF